MHRRPRLQRKEVPDCQEPYADLALCNTQIINIEYGIAIIYLFEILNLDHFTLNFEF